ncbi:hypothetical protein ACHWQZ_G009221 [Mnemiopsis leidyi]
MPCQESCQKDKVLNLASKGRAMVLQEALRKSEGCIFCCNKNKDTLLILASKHGHQNVVQILLDHFGCDYIEFFNKTGKRALHEAAQNNHPEIAEFLISKGASVDALKQGDWTPLMLAAEKQNLEIVELLVKYGADVTLTNKDGWNAFHIAARSGKVEVLEYLYSLDSELIETVSKNGRTPLHSAALNNCPEATSWLLQRGMSPNVADSSGLTPLMDGARMGHEKVCEILLSHGADVLQLDNLRRTTLHHVTQAGQLTMIHWCLNKAELALSKCGQSKDRVQRKDTKRADKKSSLRKPRSADETGTNNIKGNDKHYVNWKSEQGSTALHYAAKECRHQEIKLLLQAGADKNIADNFGRLPVAMTTHPDVQFLLQ